MPTKFSRLNDGWNAEPNAPDPRVRVEGRDVVLSFLMNSYAYPSFSFEDVGVIRFESCWRHRLGGANDEGWYDGQCRFSGIAPKWGDFYEVDGDLLLDESTNDWIVLAESTLPSRHFLFYLRDETFECDAKAWSFSVERGAAKRLGHLA